MARGESDLEPITPTGVGEWIRRAGAVSWSLIGVLILLYLFVREIAPIARVLLPPVAIALVVVYLLNPLVSALQNRGFRRGLAVAMVWLAFIAVITAILAAVIPVVARQISGLIDALPKYVEKATREINRLAERRGSSFRIHLTTEQVIKTVRENRETLVAFLGGVRSFATSVLHILIVVVLGAVLSIYLLVDLPKIKRALVAATPPRHRAEVSEISQKIGTALGGFFRGQFLVAAFVGVASAIGLTIVGLPFAVLVGLIAGIFNLVPLIGPFIGAIPAVAIAVLSGQPSKALWASLALLIVQQIDNHIVSPNVMGRTVKLHPITVMLGLLAGGTIAGILGMLVVVPSIAAAKILGQHAYARWLRGIASEEPEAVSGG